MTRTALLAFSLALPTLGCGGGDRIVPDPVDCSQAEAYEFLNVADFSGGDTGWFRYADATPGGVPDLTVEDSNVPVTELEAPGRCGDTRIMQLIAEGHNFWGSGFGDWAHNEAASRANGTGFEGISFWARSPVNSEKTFLLNVDDGRTIILGEGVPGEILNGTQCRLPPPEDLGDPACYNGGLDQPSNAGSRVPAPDECGNSFHTLVTTTENWQLYLIPFGDLVQWPCPNRLDGGINPADIAKFEIKLLQGTRYEIWIDNISFYRRRNSR